MTDTTPTFAVGRTYKSLKSRDKRFLSFDMNEELTILSVEGTPNGLWIARSKDDKVCCDFTFAYMRVSLIAICLFAIFIASAGVFTLTRRITPTHIIITKVGFIFTHDFAITADYVNEKMTEFYEAHKDDITKHRATATVSGGDE